MAVAAAGLGFAYADRATAWLLLTAAVAYLGGVQLPTGAINIPLNNRVQAIDLDTGEQSDVAALRVAFEDPWNRANNFRTVVLI